MLFTFYFHLPCIRLHLSVMFMYHDNTKVQIVMKRFLTVYDIFDSTLLIKSFCGGFNAASYDTYTLLRMFLNKIQS